MIIDISLPLKRGMITYPRNPHFSKTKIKNRTSTISKLSLGTHTGTHVDAPTHVNQRGLSIDAYNLNIFNGIARVLDCSHALHCVSAEDLKKFHIRKGERVLIKTKNSHTGYKKFRTNYIFLSGDAAFYLKNRGVTLVGFDYLSVKKKGSFDNTPHTHLLNNTIPIVEGLNLKSVKQGEYIMFCTPLSIQGGDGAPTRAGLLPIKDIRSVVT